MLNVDDLTQGEFLFENKQNDSRIKTNQVFFENDIEIDELNLEKFSKEKPVHSEIRKLKSFSSFASDTSNKDERNNAEMLIESPVFNKDKKNKYKTMAHKIYDIDEFLIGEDVPKDEEKPKLKKCIKYPVLTEKVQNIDELIFDNDTNDRNTNYDSDKKTILNLSLSTSSLSISDDIETLNDMKKTPKKCVRFREEIQIENLFTNKNLVNSAVVNFEEIIKSDANHPKKCGTEWLKQVTEALNLTTHGDSGYNESAKKTSPTSITENTSNLYLQENDVKRRKCKYIKNGMAEKLQKILLRQASSLNFIKHQQTKDEKCSFIFFSEIFQFDFLIWPKCFKCFR